MEDMLKLIAWGAYNGVCLLEENGEAEGLGVRAPVAEGTISQAFMVSHAGRVFTVRVQEVKL